jgi:phage host-nuclease inhibitor protein Gam
MATPQNEPLDRLDELGAKLGIIQLEILGILTIAGQEHQAIDANHAPELNPLYREAQSVFDQARAICETHREELIKSGKKSAKRNTLTVGWSITPRIALHLPEEDIIARIRSHGRSAALKLIRRTVKHELNRDALKATANRDLVRGIEGIEILRKDDFYAIPTSGLRMSENSSYWPALEGVSGHLALTTVLSDEQRS